ncbi:Cytochrome P450, E-class, group I,Cytochrome P450,Cytochrome P450, conserved site [Cinara cedri]|uniref:Cytochrome P450, E-class, group I,Cytochrome P450,Cytochrome P450, conserved site n=1 Tax=Cinara cedri TaxID=506608 RepID=A0A5E4NK79_9HEMI|nr:Cytochrome P450, E-class, group I,Cytochrome P450,Cytochrome P450, conserved site [Cinara cedri]
METANLQSLTSVAWQPIACYATIALFALWYGHRWLQNLEDLSHHKKLTSKMNGPKVWPIVGNALELIGSAEMVVNKITQMTLDYGPKPFRFWMGSHLFMVITQPEDLQIVLNSSKALDKPWLYDMIFDVMAESTFLAKGKRWRNNRSIYNAFFNIKILHKYFPIFQENNQLLIKDLNKQVGKTELFDLWEYIAVTNVNSICHIVLGYDLKEQPYGTSNTIHIAVELAIKAAGMRAYQIWLHPYFIFKLYQRFTGISKKINRGYYFLDQILTIKKEELKREKSVIKKYPSDFTNENHKSFFETILESSEKIENFSDKYIREEIISFFAAGSETMTATTCFCLLMLAIHQDIQNKVYDEIYNVFGDGDEIIIMEDTAQLVYLEQVLKETIRMYPPIPIIIREIQEDIQISSGNHVIPKGTACVINLLGTHYIPTLYPNPRVFNPENFNKENIATRHKYSFMGFSRGARNCIGNQYAMQYMKVQLSMILRNFSVHTNITMDDIKVKSDIMLRSVNGFPVTIRPRNTPSTVK